MRPREAMFALVESGDKSSPYSDCFGRRFCGSREQAMDGGTEMKPSVSRSALPCSARYGRLIDRRSTEFRVLLWRSRG